MSVTEIKQAIGGWELRLGPGTPRDVLDKLTFFGHIALIPGRADPAQYGDNLLGMARYVGVYRGRDAQDELVLKGSGMAFWLGDEDDKGDVLEAEVSLSGATFAAAINALLPAGGAVTAGTINSVPGTYTGKHRWETPRKAITYVTDVFGAEFRVNNNGTLDAGMVTQLYVTNPKALLLPKDFGIDMFRKALRGKAAMGVDVEDITTRVVLLAEGEGTAIATGNANAPATPYKDIHGNPIKATRVVSESGTEAGNATIRAQLQLNRFLNARRSVALSTSEYDVKGTFVVGDYLDVYDPVNGFIDTTREVMWKGQPINPMALRCVEMSWPIPAGWTVAFRDINGVWIDLSAYYTSETGDTTIVVGELARGLASVGGEAIGVRPNLPVGGEADTTIPGTPAFTALSTGVYESNDRTLSAIRAQWSQPLNTDLSTITDGDHYEIRYRPNRVIGYKVGWDILSGGYATDFTESFAGTGSNAWPAGWTLTNPVTQFSWDNGLGYIDIDTINSLRGAHRSGLSMTDQEVYAQLKVPAAATTSNVVGVVMRKGAQGYYWLRAEVNTDKSVTTKISRQDPTNGIVEITPGLKVRGMTNDSTQWLWVKGRISGEALSIKVWQGELADEPVEEHQTVVDPMAPLSLAGNPGLQHWIVGGSTLTPPVRITHGQFIVRNLVPDNAAAGWTWDELGTWDTLLSDPIQATVNWTNAVIPWDTTTHTIMELGPGVQYELQIRAVDSANPPKAGAWSVSSFVITTGDVIAPSAPGAPIVAGSMVAIQVEHHLGKASGGEYNLEQDLHHLDVHVGGDEVFQPLEQNKVGELIANAGMMQAMIPALGTFKVDATDNIWVKCIAVDRTGNRSQPGEASPVTVELIDDAHISDLSVSKLTAGTISAQAIITGSLKTAESGARVELNEYGVQAYGTDGRLRTSIESWSGNVFATGEIQTKADDGRIALIPGDVSEFYMDIIPLAGGTKDHWLRMSTYEDVVWGQVVFYEVETTDGMTDGGKLLYANRMTILSHQLQGQDEAFLSLGNWPAAGSGGYGRIYFRGKYTNNTVFEGTDTHYIGVTTVGAGFGSLILTYGPTMVGNMVCIPTISGANVDYNVPQNSGTTFTIQWADATAHVVWNHCTRTTT